MPLVENTFNKRKFRFIDVGFIWKFIPFKTSDKRKHSVMHFILSCIQPKYIISMNWLTQRESLYMVWTAKHPKSKFIVLQHGAYVGGIVTDKPHKYTKCDIFLTWGSFFSKEFKRNNSLKKVNIIDFGNTIYNKVKRENFAYKDKKTNKILLLPTALNKGDLLHFYNLINRLKELDFQIVVKEHAKQGIEKDKNGIIKYPSIEGLTKITGPLYPILQNNDFDFIIADHSTALLDAIFFKNKVLYFDPKNNIKGYTTQYSKYLMNIFLDDYSNKGRNYFKEAIYIENQEALFANMVTLGNNNLEII
jgi:hypothetical protein